MIQKEKLFGLGPGRLYIAPPEMSEKEAMSLACYAGPTKDGVTLFTESRIHEITDADGVLIRSIRYGERLRLTGKFSRLYPQVIARALGLEEHGTEILFGQYGKGGRGARLRVVLVCTLPEEAGGAEMRFSMTAGITSPFRLPMNGEREGGIPFTLTAETDGAGFSGRLVFE